MITILQAAALLLLIAALIAGVASTVSWLADDRPGAWDVPLDVEPPDDLAAAEAARLREQCGRRWLR